MKCQKNFVFIVHEYTVFYKREFIPYTLLWHIVTLRLWKLINTVNVFGREMSLNL